MANAGVTEGKHQAPSAKDQKSSKFQWEMRNSVRGIGKRIEILILGWLLFFVTSLACFQTDLLT